jgi:hypothetical protein
MGLLSRAGPVWSRCRCWPARTSAGLAWVGRFRQPILRPITLRQLGPSPGSERQRRLRHVPPVDIGRLRVLDPLPHVVAAAVPVQLRGLHQLFGEAMNRQNQVQFGCRRLRKRLMRAIPAEIARVGLTRPDPAAPGSEPLSTLPAAWQEAFEGAVSAKIFRSHLTCATARTICPYYPCGGFHRSGG